MVRAPEVFGEGWNRVAVEDFTHPTYAAVFGAVAAAGAASGDWPQPVLGQLDDPTAASVVVALATEPLLRPASPSYAAEYVAKLRLLAVSRSIANLKSKLQRTNPVDNQVQYNRMFASLLELEQQRRELNDIAAGPAV